MEGHTTTRYGDKAKELRFRGLSAHMILGGIVDIVVLDNEKHWNVYLKNESFDVNAFLSKVVYYDDDTTTRTSQYTCENDIQKLLNLVDLRWSWQTPNCVTQITGPYVDGWHYHSEEYTNDVFPYTFEREVDVTQGPEKRAKKYTVK